MQAGAGFRDDMYALPVHKGRSIRFAQLERQDPWQHLGGNNSLPRAVEVATKQPGLRGGPFLPFSRVPFGPSRGPIFNDTPKSVADETALFSPLPQWHTSPHTQRRAS